MADQPVVVYGLDTSIYYRRVSGAAAVIMGKSLFTSASYPGLSVQSEYQTIKATSEFALVSAYDNTIVKIALTVPTTSATGAQSHNAGDVFSVTLNKGQVYQVQAMKIANGVNQADLSMTEITSSQPVGVLAGDKCTTCPCSGGFIPWRNDNYTQWKSIRFNLTPIFAALAGIGR